MTTCPTRSNYGPRQAAPSIAAKFLRAPLSLDRPGGRGRFSASRPLDRPPSRLRPSTDSPLGAGIVNGCSRPDKLVPSSPKLLLELSLPLAPVRAVNERCPRIPAKPVAPPRAFVFMFSNEARTCCFSTNANAPPPLAQRRSNNVGALIHPASKGNRVYFFFGSSSFPPDDVPGNAILASSANRVQHAPLAYHAARNTRRSRPLPELSSRTPQAHDLSRKGARPSSPSGRASSPHALQEGGVPHPVEPHASISPARLGPRWRRFTPADAAAVGPRQSPASRASLYTTTPGQPRVPTYEKA